MSDQEVLQRMITYYVMMNNSCDKCGQKSVIRIMVGKTYASAKSIYMCNSCYLASINSIPLSSKCIYTCFEDYDHEIECFTCDSVFDHIWFGYELKKL